MSRSKGDRRVAERAGRRAEGWAALFLRFKGYRILEMRYKTKYGEVDIIAARGNAVVFVEVKQRQTLSAAIGTVGYASEKRIMDAAEVYLTRAAKAPPQDYSLRFDVIYVIGRWKVHHISDAFRGY